MELNRTLLDTFLKRPRKCYCSQQRQTKCGCLVIWFMSSVHVDWFMMTLARSLPQVGLHPVEGWTETGQCDLQGDYIMITVLKRERHRVLMGRSEEIILTELLLHVCGFRKRVHDFEAHFCKTCEQLCKYI